MMLLHFECRFKINTQVYDAIIYPSTAVDQSGFPRFFRVLLNGAPFGMLMRTEQHWQCPAERPHYLIEEIGEQITLWYQSLTGNIVPSILKSV
ncbi:hypothetical protein [Flavihumibacter petaseus]|uniref:Uncharacterized protein n=1 Tax=Flavihumibacter petaseus NBRC 106054 TaxID=1220578 RepID=A0A0E9MVQ6_9BACT|nr:hypothetical protein [Flavihumibacter petaseus]GAO41573.1 hypothetical protein FPE01S_01_05870 [Flavihumibacter petaseus NBRC 106054]